MMREWKMENGDSHVSFSSREPYSPSTEGEITVVKFNLFSSTPCQMSPMIPSILSTFLKSLFSKYDVFYDWLQYFSSTLSQRTSLCSRALMLTTTKGGPLTVCALNMWQVSHVIWFPTWTRGLSNPFSVPNVWLWKFSIFHEESSFQNVAWQVTLA